MTWHEPVIWICILIHAAVLGYALAEDHKNMAILCACAILFEVETYRAIKADK